MKYSNYTTFKAKQSEGILTVTFDYPPVNIQGIPMFNDLEKLADTLENDKDIKVVVFQSANPEVFIAHADVSLFIEMSPNPIPRTSIKPSKFQNILNRISNLPQATIAKVEGFARGGGHEFVLACDMRFAARGKAVFMQMEVGMGILPCIGGASRMARQTGLGRALEIILSAKDFDADTAEKYGIINKALDPNEIGKFVDDLASRISKFPSESITACKRAVYASIDLPIEDALKEEEYQLHQALSKTPAIQRFNHINDTNFQNNLNNQRNFETLLMDLQEIK